MPWLKMQQPGLWQMKDEEACPVRTQKNLSCKHASAFRERPQLIVREPIMMERWLA